MPPFDCPAIEIPTPSYRRQARCFLSGSVCKGKCDQYTQMIQRTADAMMPWKDAHKGQRGFILATGPSLATQNISWLRDEITLGVNFAHKVTLPQGWTPTYMVSADANVVNKLKDEWEKLRTRVVVTDTVILQAKYSASNLLTRRGISLYYREKQFDWNVVTGVKIQKAYSTVIHLALPWAFWLGLNPIYLLGCDCTAAGHAYDDKGVVCPSAMTLWQQGFFPSMIAVRTEAQRCGVQLYNATRGGVLQVLPRVNFDQMKPIPQPRTRWVSKRRDRPHPPSKSNVTGKTRRNAKHVVAPGDSRVIVNSGEPNDFYNIYSGRRGFILATGPSVAEQDIAWLKDEVVVGVNFAHKVTHPYGFEPTFTCTADHRLFAKIMDEYEHLGTSVVCTDTCRRYCPMYKSPNLATRKGVGVFYSSAFDWNCDEGVRVYKGSSSVGMIAIPWALWIGLNPIYLLGCDCTERGHAYDDKGAYSPRAMMLWKTKFFPAMRNIRRILEMEGRQIYNATLGGNLEELQRVDFDSLRPQARKVM